MVREREREGGGGGVVSEGWGERKGRGIGRKGGGTDLSLRY